MTQLIFNTSMPRSGSELFQAICHQNPEIYASATSPLLEYQFAARGNYDLPEVKSQEPAMMQKAFIAMCRGMADSYYSTITDRPVVIDKNRGWSHYYEWVEQWNPEPKMVCLVRDLRDVFASMERIYRANRHSPQGIDNPAELQNMTVMDRVNYWSQTQPIGLALLRTADCFQRGVSAKILFIKYEKLCNQPAETMNIFYEYVGLPGFTHNFNDIQKQVVEDDSRYGIFGQHRIAPQITPYAPWKWSEVFSEEIGNHIYNSHRWFFDTFEYLAEHDAKAH